MRQTRIDIGWTTWYPLKRQVWVDGEQMFPDRFASSYTGPNDRRRWEEPSWEADFFLTNGLCAVLIASKDKRGLWEIALQLWPSPAYKEEAGILEWATKGVSVRVVPEEPSYRLTIDGDPEDGAEVAAILKAWSQLQVIR